MFPLLVTSCLFNLVLKTQSIAENLYFYSQLREELKLLVSSGIVAIVMRPGYHVPLVILG